MQKKAQFAVIINHPDRDQIVSRLVDGQSTRNIAEWLQNKYPDDPARVISQATLAVFRKEHLNIHGTILDDLRSQIKQEERHEMTKSLVTTNKKYQEKIAEIVDNQIDWTTRLNQFLNVAETRFGQLFDITQDNPGNLKPDRSMIEWLRNMLEIIREIRKVQGAPDQVIQHNVTVQAIDEQAAVIQQAFINTISECDIELASKLIDRFHNHLNALKNKQDEPSLLYQDKNIDKIEKVMARVIPPGQ